MASSANHVNKIESIYGKFNAIEINSMSSMSSLSPEDIYAENMQSFSSSACVSVCSQYLNALVSSVSAKTGEVH